jgi:hypothetical protein
MLTGAIVVDNAIKLGKAVTTGAGKEGPLFLGFGATPLPPGNQERSRFNQLQRGLRRLIGLQNVRRFLLLIRFIGDKHFQTFNSRGATLYLCPDPKG